MSDQITVQGMVLSTMPIGENDKRLVILTQELGRISTFARGARRPGSTLMAASNPFVTGQFTLIQGRNSYNLIAVNIRDYFTELAADQPGVYYGYYFLDFANYYGQENVDGTETLNLLYLSLKAILKPQPENALIRRIFEIRLMTINGDYAIDGSGISPETRYVIDFIMHAPLTKLFTFSVTPEVQQELDANTEKHMSRVVDRPLKSKKILEMMIS